VKTVCHPESTKFYSKACGYGLSHETDALYAYNDDMQATHTLFDLKSVLDSENPFIAASPDGMISCSCCGNGA